MGRSWPWTMGCPPLTLDFGLSCYIPLVNVQSWWLLLLAEDIANLMIFNQAIPRYPLLFQTLHYIYMPLHFYKDLCWYWFPLRERNPKIFTFMKKGTR